MNEYKVKIEFSFESAISLEEVVKNFIHSVIIDELPHAIPDTVKVEVKLVN